MTNYILFTFVFLLSAISYSNTEILNPFDYETKSVFLDYSDLKKSSHLKKIENQIRTKLIKYYTNKEEPSFYSKYIGLMNQETFRATLPYYLLGENLETKFKSFESHLDYFLAQTTLLVLPIKLALEFKELTILKRRDLRHSILFINAALPQSTLNYIDISELLNELNMSLILPILTSDELQEYETRVSFYKSKIDEAKNTANSYINKIIALN